MLTRTIDYLVDKFRHVMHP